MGAECATEKQWKAPIPTAIEMLASLRADGLMPEMCAHGNDPMDNICRILDTLSPLIDAGRDNEAARAILEVQSVLGVVAEKASISLDDDQFALRLGTACVFIDDDEIRRALVGLFCCGMDAAAEAMAEGRSFDNIGYEATRRLMNETYKDQTKRSTQR